VIRCGSRPFLPGAPLGSPLTNVVAPPPPILPRWRGCFRLPVGPPGSRPLLLAAGPAGAPAPVLATTPRLHPSGLRRPPPPFPWETCARPPAPARCGPPKRACRTPPPPGFSLRSPGPRAAWAVLLAAVPDVKKTACSRRCGEFNRLSLAKPRLNVDAPPSRFVERPLPSARGGTRGPPPLAPLGFCLCRRSPWPSSRRGTPPVGNFRPPEDPVPDPVPLTFGVTFLAGLVEWLRPKCFLTLPPTRGNHRPPWHGHPARPPPVPGARPAFEARCAPGSPPAFAPTKQSSPGHLPFMPLMPGGFNPLPPGGNAGDGRPPPPPRTRPLLKRPPGPT